MADNDEDAWYSVVVERKAGAHLTRVSVKLLKDTVWHHDVPTEQGGWNWQFQGHMNIEEAFLCAHGKIVQLGESNTITRARIAAEMKEAELRRHAVQGLIEEHAVAA